MNDRLAIWLVEQRLLLGAISLVVIAVLALGLGRLQFSKLT